MELNGPLHCLLVFLATGRGQYTVHWSTVEPEWEPCPGENGRCYGIVALPGGRMDDVMGLSSFTPSPVQNTSTPSVSVGHTTGAQIP